MPRYYFHIRCKGRLITDNKGRELDGIQAAQREAIASARKIANEALREDRWVKGDRVEVRDDDGEIVMAVPVRSVLN